MSNMKLIMESWNSFLLEDQKEDLEQLKDSPQEAKDLITKLVNSGAEQQKAAAKVLVQDPEVMEAARILKAIAEKEGIEEGILADKVLQTYISGTNKLKDFFETPMGQKLKQYGGPVLAMALFALKAPELEPGDMDTLSKLAVSSQISGDEAAANIIDIIAEKQRKQ
jgi:hypothetical protein